MSNIWLLKVVDEFNLKLRASARNLNELTFISSEFPNMQCEWSSYLLAIHIFKCTNVEVIELICGYCEDWQGPEEISHYWLELDGMVLDITADQYNLIDNRFLDKSIIDGRPFLPLYCVEARVSPHKLLFTERERTRISRKFDLFTDEGLREWEVEYALIMA